MNDADDPRINRVTEILKSLQYEDLASSERAKLERELDALGQVLDEPRDAVYFNFIRSLDWFKKRQGSVVPDFDQLYRKKSELDRKLLE